MLQYKVTLVPKTHSRPFGNKLKIQFIALLFVKSIYISFKMSSSEASDTEITETLAEFQFEPKKNTGSRLQTDGQHYDKSSRREKWIET